jgi:hypothetical protein
MIGRGALLGVADQTGTWLLTEVADLVLISPVCEVEVVDFSAKNAFLVTFLNSMGP